MPKLIYENPLLYSAQRGGSHPERRRSRERIRGKGQRPFYELRLAQCSLYSLLEPKLQAGKTAFRGLRVDPQTISRKPSVRKTSALGARYT